MAVTDTTCLETVGAYPLPPVGLALTTPEEDRSCDVKFDACITPESSGKLIAYLSAVQRWMRNASTMCQSKKPAVKPEGESDAEPVPNS